MKKTTTTTPTTTTTCSPTAEKSSRLPIDETAVCVPQAEEHGKQRAVEAVLSATRDPLSGNPAFGSGRLIRLMAMEQSSAEQAAHTSGVRGGKAYFSENGGSGPT